MRKTYRAQSDTEATGMYDGRVTLLVIPIDLPPQYIAGKKPQSYGPADAAFFDPADPVGTYPTLRTCPYAPGDEIAVKARWNPNGHESLNLVCAKVIVQSVAVRPVRNISINEAVATGTRDLRTIENTIVKNYVECFRDEWDRRHPDLPFATAWAWFVTATRKEAK